MRFIFRLSLKYGENQFADFLQTNSVRERLSMISRCRRTPNQAASNRKAHGNPAFVSTDPTDQLFLGTSSLCRTDFISVRFLNPNIKLNGFHKRKHMWDVLRGKSLKVSLI
ncbi:hypothetical protein AVEN_266355-1 [Araneus ventricosus]|uniref:Uncharacterized protein n=1 Tax=Araneus ventricosus TaxID=182803 RepID=A0A4Y2CPN9_ARAVE|nr:hypothetical protein AVEN_266355-1 [Araneus ventricosus]